MDFKDGDDYGVCCGERRCAQGHYAWDLVVNTGVS